MNALIVGGSRGIGAACVRAFTSAGHRAVFTWHSDAHGADAVCAQTHATAIRADAATAAEMGAAVITAAVDMGGRLDALVYNAGAAYYGLLQDMNDADWQRVMDVDLNGAFYACRAALPLMLRRKYGRIVFISSMWGQVGASCEAAYSAAKAGLIGLCRALAKEVGPSGITVNCVAPGAIDTAMMAAFSPADRAALCADIPAGRLGTPDEVARSVLFLADEASGYINGQVLGQNGGMVV